MNHGAFVITSAGPAVKGADDVEGGARIRFAAVDPKDIEQLRTKLRERASAMNAATCK